MQSGIRKNVLILALTLGGLFAQDSGTLTIRIDGFEDDSGQAMVAVHQSAKTYLKRVEPYRRGIVKIHEGKAEAIFEGLPHGQYSVSVFHDKNANNDLDALFGLIPKEDYGFSNNVRKKYGPPKFKDTLFAFDQPAMDLSITLMSALKKGEAPPDEATVKKLMGSN